LHVAALRETFEECDLLLHGPDWDVQDADLARAKVRERLSSGMSFLQAMADADLRPLPTLQLQPWSRWITPRRPSMMDRRFDTRFFVAIAPADQQARHDEHEITEALWLRPNEAMQRYWEGELTLAPVQLLTLMQVGRYRRAVQVMQAARSRAPMQVLPEPHDIDGQRVLCYPGDPGHSVREPAWEGPTRMTFRNGRFEPEGGLQALLS
jgi:8-oxo-dGTP pyrophosphatase MutT (NUDIX family)